MPIKFSVVGGLVTSSAGVGDLATSSTVDGMWSSSAVGALTIVVCREIGSSCVFGGATNTRSAFALVSSWTILTRVGCTQI